ncbi:MAG: hypothetical protein QOE90_1711 [Thermoplasmata archaeon]|jgi:hypothetical protein|nr:hypothetical protein [Thermoplasmata archaeon]
MQREACGAQRLGEREPPAGPSSAPATCQAKGRIGAGKPFVNLSRATDADAAPRTQKADSTAGWKGYAHGTVMLLPRVTQAADTSGAAPPPKPRKRFFTRQRIADWAVPGMLGAVFGLIAGIVTPPMTSALFPPSSGNLVLSVQPRGPDNASQAMCILNDRPAEEGMRAVKADGTCSWLNIKRGSLEVGVFSPSPARLPIALRTEPNGTITAWTTDDDFIWWGNSPVNAPESADFRRSTPFMFGWSQSATNQTAYFTASVRNTGAPMSARLVCGWGDDRNAVKWGTFNGLEIGNETRLPGYSDNLSTVQCTGPFPMLLSHSYSLILQVRVSTDPSMGLRNLTWHSPDYDWSWQTTDARLFPPG